MKWLQNLNETKILESGMVQFDVFAEGEGLEVSLDNITFISPNIEKDGHKGFRFWVNPKSVKASDQGIKLQNFWVKEWGCLKVPENIQNQELPEREKLTPLELQKPTNIQVVDDNSGLMDLWSKGCVGYAYGSDYWKELNELDGGESKFEFHGQIGVNYPKPYTQNDTNRPQATDELVSIHLPSHSVTAIWGYKHARAGILIEIYDENNEMVFNLYDSKGGLHPIANAIGENIGKAQRGNNHPDNCNRWIKYGVYKFRFINLSEFTDKDNFALTCKIEDTQGNVYFSRVINPREQISAIIDIKPLSSKGHGYKLNCNYLPLS